MNNFKTNNWGTPLYNGINPEHSIVFQISACPISLEPNIFKHINQIANLEFNWDGYDAIVPNIHTLGHIKSFLKEAGYEILSKIKDEDVFANPHGTIVIRVESGENYVNIEFGEKYANYYALINSEIKYKREGDNKMHTYFPNEIRLAFNELFKS